MDKEKIVEAYYFRHACKEFDGSRKIDRADFEFILETGRLSPSSFGYEPWKFVVLQNMNIREKLLPVTWGAQKQLPTASHFVIILARTKKDMVPDSNYLLDLLENVKGVPKDMIPGRMNRLRTFLESDFEIMDNDRAMFEWSCRQTYIALGNMMTAAAQIGIDSCPIEGFDKAKVESILKDEGLMDGESFGVSCMVAFGYRVREPMNKIRQPIERVVQWMD
jgi:nitroreductase